MVTTTGKWRATKVRDVVESLRWLKRDEGQSLLEMALVLPVLVLLLAGAVDFGRAYYVMIEVSAAAQAGALYGVQNPVDTAGMVAAAMLDASDITMTATASNGNECSDGTGSVSITTAPSCGAMNAMEWVEVDTSTTYTSIMPYPGVPSPLVLTGKARMRTTN